MSGQFAKVKYSLYNSDSFQTNSDEEDDGGGNSFSNLNSKYISRKIRFTQDTRIQINDLPTSKGGDRGECSNIGLQLKKALNDENVSQLLQLLSNLSVDACKQRINSLDANKRGLLHYAARYNQVEIAELLIEKGADVNIEGEDGLTPLHFAARYGYNKSTKCLSEPVDEVLTENASVISVLIEEGAHVNCQDNYGMTPLHYTAIRGNVNAATELLRSNKINTEISDKQEMTALHCGANYNSPAVVKLLLAAKAHPEASDENSSTPLHLAATTGNKEIVVQLLESVEKSGDKSALSNVRKNKLCFNKPIF